MEMSGEQRIPAPRQVVWDALNDPEVLKASIPGCESLEQNEAGDAFDAKVRAKVGPVSARFAGSVTLSDINAPESYTISGEGKGGAAGFAKGGAKVKLTEDGAETLLSYDVDAKVGGKLAQLGSRLIDGTARKMADDFFARFSAIAAERAGGGAPSEPAPTEAAEPTETATGAATPEPQPEAPKPTESAELPKAEPAAEPTETASGTATPEPQPEAPKPTESAELPKAEPAAEPTESASGAAAPEAQQEPAQPAPKPQPTATPAAEPTPKDEATKSSGGLPPAVWIGVLVAIIAILLFLIL